MSDARTPAELISAWQEISRAPDELRGYLDEYPFRLANLMPSHGGEACEGRIWLDAGLVADRDVSPAWLLALYLHEAAHASLQRAGRDASHTAEFAKLAWALALRHGVRQHCQDVYDMHETSAWESRKTTDARWAAAKGGSIGLANSAADPLAVSQYLYARNYVTLHKQIVVALLAGFCCIGVWIAASANLLPNAPDAMSSIWQTLRDDPLAQFVAGAAVLILALWSATR